MNKLSDRKINSCLRMSISFMLVLTGCAVFASVLSAQDLRDAVPEPVSPQVVAPPEGAFNPAVATKSSDDETVMVEALRGLIFLTDSSQVEVTRGVPSEGINTIRVPMLDAPEAREAMKEYLGKPISMASLNRLINDIYKYYFQTDTPFVVISLPEQDITNGVVQLVVSEGKAGEIKIEGARYFSEDLYRSLMRVKSGDPIRKSVIEQDAEWINKNPFRAGTFYMEPGSDTASTNLVFRVNERLPVRVYLGFNNTGSETTGKSRLFTGINWGNVFGTGHQFSYQFTTNSELEDYAAHSGSYVIPLPWRDFLTFSGIYSNIKSKLPSPFDQEGKSSQLSVKYDKTLPSYGSYTQGLSGLFEYKSSDNNLEFSDIPITDNETQILQWSLVYTGELADALGATSLAGQLTYSPGDWSNHNKSQYFNISRASAEADYAYLNLQLTRSLLLPDDFSLFISATAQFSNKNLLGSEQLGFSGTNGVRGYEDNAVYGDEGYLLNLEYRFPEISPSRIFAEKLNDQLQPYLFLDYGRAENVDLLQGEDSATRLKSAGIGFRYNWDRYLSMSFSYGIQLTALEGEDRGSKGHLSVILSY